MDFLYELIVGSGSNFFGGLALAAFLLLFSIPSRLFGAILLRIRSKELSSKLRAGVFDRVMIEKSLKNYIRPYSSSVDPSLEEEPRNSLVVVREPLFPVMDKVIDDEGHKKKYVLLLADSGMGKTSFFLNYFHHRNSTRKFKTSVHLFLLSDPNFDEKIKSINQSDRQSIDLFLDALDEDDRAKNRVEDRVKEILSVAYGFNSVVISCRTQFFQSEKEVPEDTRIYKIGPVGLNESKSYIFRKIYISPFDNKQIDRYVGKVYPGLFFYKKRRDARKIIDKIPSLSVRPMLLTHIPDVIKSRRDIRHSCDLYEIMINAWLTRESHWIRPDSLREFSEKLAFDMLMDNSELSGYGATIQEIVIFCEKNNFSIDLGNLTSRSLLNRGMKDRFKFSHRSIMEYLAIDYIYRNKINGIELTDQMYFFLLEKLGIEPSSGRKLRGIAKTNFVKAKRAQGYLTDRPLFDFAGRIDSGVLDSPIVTEFNGNSLEEIKRISTIRLVIDHIRENLRLDGYSTITRSELRIFGPDFGMKTKCLIVLFTDDFIVTSNISLDFSKGFNDDSSRGDGRVIRDAYNKLSYFFRDDGVEFTGIISIEESKSNSEFYIKRIFQKQNHAAGKKYKPAIVNGAVSWSRITSNFFYLNILKEAVNQESSYLPYGIFGKAESIIVEKWGAPRVIKKNGGYSA